MRFEVTDMSDWIENKPKEPPALVEDWLFVGDVGSITGSTKSNKSWTIEELAVALATGGEWIGRECMETNVLVLDGGVRKFAFKQTTNRYLPSQ